VKAYRERLLPLFLLRLARGRPLSEQWGYDRGQPIDRHFIELFLDKHRSDIRGRVLEVKSGDYARQFGAAVDRIDVLDIDPSNAEATVVADLAAAVALPDESFDCFILTQVLQYVYDVGAALREARRVLRPGGVLLATVPSVSRAPDESAGLHDYWRFTEASCRELVSREFQDERALVRAYGNVLSCTAFLAGLATEDVPRSQLERQDPRFPLLVAIRAVRT
jgi:SAM-dependent methyltransferase